MCGRSVTFRETIYAFGLRPFVKCAAGITFLHDSKAVDAHEQA
jgi:hypothetical protein